MFDKNHPFFEYKGIVAAQVKSIQSLFTEQFLSKFGLIIEIGTNRGGLSHYIIDVLNQHSKETKFYTYEINPSCVLLPKDLSWNGQILLTSWDSLSEANIKRIIDEHSNEKPTLVLCDGGNKEQEFNAIVPYLKSGDHIMLHDYTNGDNLALFKANGWYSDPEAFEINIQHTIDKFNLKEDPTSLQYLWGHFIK